jgi:hypothetical protein
MSGKSMQDQCKEVVFRWRVKTDPTNAYVTFHQAGKLNVQHSRLTKQWQKARMEEHALGPYLGNLRILHGTLAALLSTSSESATKVSDLIGAQSKPALCLNNVEIIPSMAVFKLKPETCCLQVAKPGEKKSHSLAYDGYYQALLAEAHKDWMRFTTTISDKLSSVELLIKQVSEDLKVEHLAEPTGPCFVTVPPAVGTVTITAERKQPPGGRARSLSPEPKRVRDSAESGCGLTKLAEFREKSTRIHELKANSSTVSEVQTEELLPLRFSDVQDSANEGSALTRVLPLRSPGENLSFPEDNEGPDFEVEDTQDTSYDSEEALFADTV